jgi:Holliday junction resolvase RusA-like endonuclease
LKKIICLSFFLVSILLSNATLAQQGKTKEAQSASSIDPQTDNSKDFSYLPSTSTESKSKKSAKKFQIFSSKENKRYKNSYAWQLDQKMEEYQERMKDVVKQDRKDAKMAKKPQYSDPSYFGHKHKPKKRKPGKRKYCKECHLVH